jgi:hypothetical protein
MTNDAKLGLLAGVAGVVAAAVFSRVGDPAPLPAPTPAVVVRVPDHRAPRPDDRKAEGHGVRPEVAAVAVSRAAHDDE